MSVTNRKTELRRVLGDLTIMAVLGVVLALVGPFGSFGLPFAWRLVYWVGLSLGGYACYRPIAGAVVDWARDLELPEPAAWILACLIATVPMSVLVWFVGRLPGPFPLPTLEEAFASYAYVLVVGGTLTALFYVLERQKDVATTTARPTASTKDQTTAPVQVRFLERIPQRLGSELLALEMEDHYLRVHTALGSDLILLRMRDAVAELDGFDGLQVHRSWWVARAAVERVEREGRGLRLVLTGGLQVPVARDQVATVKAKGW